VIVANFAPLNLVDDLGGLFAKFDALTSPNGKILASVLNPWFIGSVRSRLWWREAPRLLRHSEVFLPGPQAPHYRRLFRRFRIAAAPHFRLSRVLRGPPAYPWLNIAGCRYVFLFFKKSA
jgi:hypothetical protein